MLLNVKASHKKIKIETHFLFEKICIPQQQSTSLMSQKLNIFTIFVNGVNETKFTCEFASGGIFFMLQSL